MASTGTFDINEQVKLALNNLLSKSMTSFDKPWYSDLPNPTREFPKNIMSTNILNKEPTNDNPYTTILNYYLIDPSSNKITNIQVKDIDNDPSVLNLTDSEINSLSDTHSKSSGIINLSKDMYCNNDNSNNYNGVLLLDLNELSSSEIETATDGNKYYTDALYNKYLIPHIKLYIRLPTEYFGGSKSSNDNISFQGIRGLLKNAIGPAQRINLWITKHNSFGNNISRIDESEYIVSETGGIVSFYKTNYTDVDIDKEPNITFFRYVGDTGFQTPIKFGLDTSKNSLSNIFNNDLFISTDTNKIYRYNGSDTTWKEILGSGSSSGSSNNNNNNITVDLCSNFIQTVQSTSDAGSLLIDTSYNKLYYVNSNKDYIKIGIYKNEDVSFNNVEITNNLNVNGKITSNEASFDTINVDNIYLKDLSLTNLDVSINVTIDGSLSAIEASFGNIYNKDYINSEFNNIDNSLSILSSDVSTIDNSLIIITSDISTIDNSLSIVTSDISTLDNSMIFIYENTINDLSGFPIKISSISPTNAIEGRKGEAILNSLSNKLYINIDGSSNWKHINNSVSSGTSNTINKLNDISDVSYNISDICNGDILKWNDSESKWIIGKNDRSVNNRGQSLFEIMTEQPAKFDNSGDIFKSSDKVILNWSYDNIIANSKINTLARLSFHSPSNKKKSMLPKISSIIIEISGNNDIDHTKNSTWIQYKKFTPSNSETYDVSIYKSITINKTSTDNINLDICSNILYQTSPFDIRIYGENFAEDYPSKDNRALYYRDLSFSLSDVPSKPIYVSENTGNNIVLTYKVINTDKSNINSSAKINKAITDISENERLSSQTITPNNTVQSIETNIENKGNNENFEINLNNIKFGTKYNYKVKAKNNMNSLYSEYSDSRLSEYTNIPQSTNGKTITFSINETNTNITSKNDLLNSNVLYINLSNKTSINMDNSIRSFEITRPESSKNDPYGFGKFIDNSYNLTSISIFVNDISKAEVLYHGFNISQNYTTSDNINIYFSDISNIDSYNDDNKKKGFRLKGQISCTDFQSISNIGFIDSSNSNVLKYIYKRDISSQSEIFETSFNIYIDDLSLNPEVDNTNMNETITIKSLVYNMGIPSVKDIEIVKQNIKYKNLNSKNMYIRGDRKIVDISFDKINHVETIYMNKSDISENGTFVLSQRDISNIFYKKTIDMSNNENNDIIKITETVYSLNKPNGIIQQSRNIDTSYKHFCDYNSYNVTLDGKINERKNNLTFFELDSTEMSKFASNFGSITPIKYINSSNEKAVQSSTLLFLDGTVRTNKSKKYPDTTVFDYNNLLPHDFTHYQYGEKSYDLSGIETIDNTGYKWITFEKTKDDIKSNTISGTTYYYMNMNEFKNEPYNISETLLNKLKDKNNNDVLGLMIAKVKDNNNSYVPRVGNLSRNLDTQGLWYSHNNADPTNSLNYILNDDNNKSYYGCLSDAVNNNNTDIWGPQFKDDDIDDIKIFIGLKNDIALEF